MNEDVRALEEENRQLQNEVNRMKQQKSGGSGKMTCIIVLVVCAVLAIPVFAVLAAVALPMYSTFKSKSKVSTALKAATSSRSAIVAWYDDRGTFGDMTVAPEGGSIFVGDERIGAGLPTVVGMTWAIVPSGDCVQIQFTFSTGCLTGLCDGFYEICCTSDGCSQTIRVGEDNPLGFDHGPEPF